MRSDTLTVAPSVQSPSLVASTGLMDNTRVSVIAATPSNVSTTCPNERVCVNVNVKTSPAGLGAGRMAYRALMSEHLFGQILAQYCLVDLGRRRGWSLAGHTRGSRFGFL